MKLFTPAAAFGLLLSLMFLFVLTECIRSITTEDTVMPDLPGAFQLTDDEASQGDQLVHEAHDLLYKKEYGRLERAGRRATAADWMFASGAQPLDAFYNGLGLIPGGGPADYHQQVILINGWCQSNPESAYAKEAMALLLLNDGQYGEKDQSESLWSTGMDYLDKVPDEKRDCCWYFCRVVLLQYTSDDEGEWTRVGVDSLHRYPDATNVAYAVTFHMEPRWGGTESSGAAFATQSGR